MPVVPVPPPQNVRSGKDAGDPTTPMPAARYFLVIPAYREANRLPAFLNELREALSGIPGGVDIQIVDDGSPLADWRALRSALNTGREPADPTTRDTCRVLPTVRLDRNTRKGGAILSAWLQAPAASSWLAFVDADGAIPAREVRRVFDEISPMASGAFFASRSCGENRADEVRRDPARRLLAAGFAMAARNLLGFSFGDSQCGFKVVRASDFRRISPGLKPHGFCFDLALWLALRRACVSVREIPVRWEERPGGRLSLPRHGPGILGELWALRREHRTKPDHDTAMNLCRRVAPTCR